jgi:hypothetical protein
MPAGILGTDNDAALKLCGGQGSAWRFATISTTTPNNQRSAS